MKPHKITCDENHVYTVDGFRVPGVTEIIEENNLSNYSGVRESVLDIAADFGNKVHKTCHLYDLKTLNIATLDKQLKPYLAGWVKFKADFGFEVIHSELQGYSPTYNFCFRLDAVGKCFKGQYSGKVIIIDIKTCTKVMPATAVQLDGYKTGYNESFKPRADDILCVRLIPDDYRIEDFKKYPYRGVFVSAANLTHFRRIIGK